ncbi:MAG: hypothetical protein MZV64_14685 [Ignavibacteriales bacterium]|nr:hypothetical protein [Ignavibacteriales bacterium]
MAGLACGNKPASRRRQAAARPAAPRARAAAARPGAEPVHEPKAADEWAYSSVGKRDPFRSLAELEQQRARSATRCATPLGKFELEQLKLRGRDHRPGGPRRDGRGPQRYRLHRPPRRLHRQERRHRGRGPLGRGGRDRVGHPRRRDQATRRRPCSASRSEAALNLEE